MSTLLGFLDGAVPEGRREAITTSVVGGQPTFPFDAIPPRSMLNPCPHCNRTDGRVLLAQIYSPREQSIFHRVLYVFGCNRYKCAMPSGQSFQVTSAFWPDVDQLIKLRRKKEREEQAKKAQPVAGISLDFGGSMFAPASPSAAAGFHSKSATGNFDQLWSMVAAKEKAVLDETKQKSQKEVVEDSTSGYVEEETDLLTKQLESKLSIYIEQAASLENPLPAYYLAVEDESHYLTDAHKSAPSSHELQLLRDYQKREGVDLSALEDAHDEEPGKNANAWTGEAYEQSYGKHVSKTFRKFQKQLAFAPEQVVRYALGSQQPLWFGDDHVKEQLIALSSSSCCPRCKRRRVFELQFMPTLLSLMPFHDHAKKMSEKENAITDAETTKQSILPETMEWGTLLVYTCPSDCFESNKQDENLVRINQLSSEELSALIARCQQADPSLVKFAEETLFVQADI